MSNFKPALPLIPAQPVDKNTIAIEIDQGDGQEQGVPVKLQPRVGLPGEPSHEVACPDGHEDHHGDPHHLGHDKPRPEAPQILLYLIHFK